MARPLVGNIGVSLHGAVRRVKEALQKPPLNDVLGQQQPQYQALGQLVWMASDIDPKAVPYRFLDKDGKWPIETLLPLEGSWALFQLFEAVQLRAAWLREEIDGFEGHDIAEVFRSVGHINQTPFFPEGNVTPTLRRALLQLPPFKTKIGWAVFLEMGTEEEGVVARLTLKGHDPFRVALHNSACFNDALDIWEPAP